MAFITRWTAIAASRNLRSVLLELRSDTISTEDGREQWALRLNGRCGDATGAAEPFIDERSPGRLGPGSSMPITKPILKNTGLLMKQPADAAREQAVEVRFGQVGILQVRLRTTQPGEILDELTGKTATAPHFFDRTPVCLDLSSLPKLPSAEDIRGVIDVVRRAGMMTVGLAQGGTSIEELANQLELPVIHHVRASTRTAPVVQAAPAPQRQRRQRRRHRAPPCQRWRPCRRLSCRLNRCVQVSACTHAIAI